MSLYVDSNGEIPTAIPSNVLYDNSVFNYINYTQKVKEIGRKVSQINSDKELDMCLDIICKRKNELKKRSNISNQWIII